MSYTDDVWTVTTVARINPRHVSDVNDECIADAMVEQLEATGQRVLDVTTRVSQVNEDALIADLGLAFAKATVLAREEAVDACRHLLEAVAEYLNQHGWGSA